MTNATIKSSFLATPKSDILCNTEVQHGSPPFLQSEILTLQKMLKFLIAKMVDFRVAQNVDFGVARKLDFVIALVIVADTSPLKGSINPGEDLLAFGTQKPENFNDKNRIYLAF